MKPQHPTLTGNTLVIQPFLTHCSHSSSYYTDVCSRKFLKNEPLTQWRKRFFYSTDQMTISGHWVVNASSVGNTKWCRVFVAASHQTRLDTRSKARRPIKVGIKGEGRSGTSRDSNLAGQCCSSAHLVQYEPDEASSFTNPNVGPGTYASLRLKLDAWSSAVQGGQRRQECSSPTRR